MGRDFEGLVRVRDTDVDGISHWIWPITDDGAWDGPVNDWLTSHKEKYLNHTLGRDVVIQAGGNCGLYPRLLSQHFKSVYTFEPDGLNFYCLTRNCESANIVKIQSALGARHEMVNIHRITDTNVGMHRVSESAMGYIPQFCIDDLRLEKCDLICLDIEGYEIHALHGAERIISMFRPTIVVENVNDQIRTFLDKYDYKEIDQSKMDTIFVSRKHLTSES